MTNQKTFAIYTTDKIAAGAKWEVYSKIYMLYVFCAIAVLYALYCMRAVLYGSRERSDALGFETGGTTCHLPWSMVMLAGTMPSC